MRRFMLSFAALLAGPVLLSACMAGAEVPPASGGFIEISGGTYRASRVVTVFSNDLVMVEQITGRGPGEITTERGRPGLFLEMASLIAEQGPGLAAAPGRPPCPDYGALELRVQPPIAGFERAMVGCPQAEMVRLQAGLLDLVGLD